MACSPRHARWCSSAHFRRVWDYREERQRQERVAEERSNGYDTELREWLAEHPLLTFRDYLIHTRQVAS